ncbi:hypothetical protein BH11VER1_BH11VER1_15600 [soil metagenome]
MNSPGSMTPGKAETQSTTKWLPIGLDKVTLKREHLTFQSQEAFSFFASFRKRLSRVQSGTA